MLDSWELQEGMSCLVWLLETELVSSERAVDVPNDPNISFLILKIILLEWKTSTHSEQSCTDKAFERLLY